MKKEFIILITAIVTISLGSLIFIPRKKPTSEVVSQSVDSVSDFEDSIQSQTKAVKPNAIKDSALIRSRNSRLLDVTYTRLEYTPDEISSGWYRTRQPLEVDTIIKSETTWEIHIIGNLDGGQPMTGNIVLQGDTMYLPTWNIESQPPHLAYHKVRIIYVIQAEGLSSDLKAIPIYR